jgi:ABC-2 type transport system permease protein
VRELRLVIGRELTEAVRRRSFWLVIGFVLLLSTAGMVGPELIDSGPDSFQVGVVGDAGQLEESLEGGAALVDRGLDVQSFDDLDALRYGVEGDVDVGVAPGDPPTVIVTAGEHQQLVGLVVQSLAVVDAQQRLADAGLSSSEIADVLAAPSPVVEELDESGAGRRAAAVILSIGLYILLFGLMMQVANGVAIEKANRISEVLLAIVRPGPLLFGKVIGVGIIGFLSLAVGILPVLVKLGLGGDLPEGIGGALLASFAWFVLGTALYLVLAGSLGALVERQEEAGSAVSPLSAILVASYLVAQTAPDSPVATALAYFPLSSPLVMPSRVADGASSGLEIAGSLALSVLAVVVVGRLGATVYRRAIVRTGRRLKWREALRSPSAAAVER